MLPDPLHTWLLTLTPMQLITALYLLLIVTLALLVTAFAMLRITTRMIEDMRGHSYAPPTRNTVDLSHLPKLPASKAQTW